MDVQLTPIIRDLKVIASNLENKQWVAGEEPKQFTLMLFVQPAVRNDSGYVGDNSSTKYDPPKEVNLSGCWEVAQVSIFGDEVIPSRAIVVESAVRNKLGETKVYKSLNTIHKEFRSIFGCRYAMQIRGL
jgi:hypothetical protein